MYGLKHAPRQWNFKFDNFMLEIRFAKCNADYCVYLRRYEDGDFLIHTLFVVDILVASSYMKEINDLKKLVGKFPLKDMGETKQCLGMQITRDRKNNKL